MDRITRSGPIPFAFLVSLLLAWGLACGKPQSASKEVPQEPQAKQETTASVQAGVDSAALAEMQKKRAQLVDEAIEAVFQTRNALFELDRGNTKKALDALAQAVGKLDLLLARAPDLKLVPIDVDSTMFDVYADIESINKAKKEALRLLKKGKVQQARQILIPLVSEIRIRVQYLPLATYPAAIKAVVPLIDAGKIDSAKMALHEALSTLVVKDIVIPLPILRAELMLQQAQELTKASEEADRQQLQKLLENARYQLQLAEALGYGDIEKDYSDLYQQLNEIEKKLKGKESTKGLFDRVADSVASFLERVKK